MIKTIYIYWGQQFANAPIVVKKCLLSWKKHNCNWTIIELDDTNLNNYININELIPDISKKNITKTALSDVIRIFLLSKYGGLWCDATTFCNKPLDEWLGDYIKTGFWAFDKPGADRLVSSWFLYAEKDNYIIKRWHEKTIEYWNTHNEMHHYFWFHYLFGDLYKTDAKFRNIWNNTKKLSADGPHYLGPIGLLNNLNMNVKNHIDNKVVPLYKLTYKYDHDRYNDKCILKYLIDPKIEFIHIGKCGGTLLISKLDFLSKNTFHLKKPLFDQNNKYLIWIRNPLHRFVSAFYMAHNLINLDTSQLDINNLNLDNCLAPSKVRRKMTHKYTFTPEYDSLINHFRTPNMLAESLTSPNVLIKQKAHKLMNRDEEHIFKGIGWYLNNGSFVENHHKNILFVGRTEHMMDDLNKLLDMLGYERVKKLDKIRENSNDNNKYLSELAISNLLNFYKDTDYKALDTLCKYKFINKDTLDSYYRYTNKN